MMIWVLSILGGFLVIARSADLECPNPEWEEYGDSCFLFKPNEMLNWNGAKRQCQTQGGYLATILNSTENEFIARGMREHTFWTSMSDFHIGLAEDQDGEYFWRDRAPVNYTNWNEGEPNDFEGDEPCVHGNKDSMRWNDIPCDTPYIGYVCRAVKVDRSVWSRFGGMEYYFSSMSKESQLDWHTANLRCNERGGYLVSIQGDAERDFITQQFVRFGYEGDYWMVLNSLGSINFRWGDGSSMNYTYWSPGQPPQQPLKNQMCAYASLENGGSWFSGHCSGKKGYVCRRQDGHDQPIVPPVTPLPRGVCPSGFIGLPESNKCFKIVPGSDKTGVTWLKAVELCRQEEGFQPDLASVLNVNESALVTSQFVKFPQGCWIGFYRNSDNKDWRWLDNQPVKWTGWSYGEPNNIEEECAMIWLNPPGTWNDAPCSMKSGYICQTFKDASTFVSTPPSTTSSICSSGWRPYRKGCYKVMASPARSWEASESTCMSQGGHLVSIVDAAENAFVQLLARDMYTDYWIGFNQNKTSNEWGWSDGWHVFTTHWAARQPETAISMACATSNQIGQWKTANCTSEYPAVCKISDVPPVTSPPAVEGTCPEEENWIAHGGSCYFFKTSGPQMSWMRALDICQGKGAVLASIHSEIDNQFVMKELTRRNENDNIWIGLHKSKLVSTWLWTDSSGLQYTKWSEGEPVGDSRDCVSLQTRHMDSWHGYWFTEPCRQKHRYICQRPKDPLPTKPAPVRGHCPDEDWDDYGRKCFLFRPDDLRSWTDAAVQCSDLGGQLIVLSSRQEASHVLQTQKKLTHRPSLSSYWLGLHKTEKGFPYMWVDGSRPDWTNWMPEEPSDIRGSDNCVSAHGQTGMWNDTSCLHLRGFVCEANKTADLQSEALDLTSSGGSGGSVWWIALGLVFGIILTGLMVFLTMQTTWFKRWISLRQHPQLRFTNILEEPSSVQYDNIKEDPDT